MATNRGSAQLPARAPQRKRPSCARERGSAYIVVLATSILVMVIGIGGLTANRLHVQASELTNDSLQARLHAQAAIDLALLHIADNPSTWRQDFADLKVLQSQSLGRGKLTATVTDPADSDLTDDTTQDVLIRGVGNFGDARMLLEVTVNSRGVPVGGTWEAVSD